MAESFVIDCSVFAKWFLPEPRREQSLSFLDRCIAGQILLVAPDLLLAELASLLSKRVRRKHIAPQAAIAVLALASGSAPRLVNTQPLLPAALDLAVSTQRSLWDNVYLALAIQEGCTFITADRRLARSHFQSEPEILVLD